MFLAKYVFVSLLSVTFHEILYCLLTVNVLSNEDFYFNISRALAVKALVTGEQSLRKLCNENCSNVLEVPVYNWSCPDQQT